MKTLFIETATESSIVGIAENNRVKEERFLPKGLFSSQYLVPEIKKMANDCCLDQIVVGVGPGSYTGIRVGVSVARGMQYALQIPLFGLPSLQFFSTEQQGLFAVVVDARIGGLYVQKGRRTQQGVDWQGPSEIVEEGLWNKTLENRVLISPHPAPVMRRLQGREVREALPSIYTALLAQNSYCEPAEILYLRKTQAELEKNERKG